MKDIKNFIKYWSPPVLYVILIYWLSSLERPFVIDVGVWNIDKLLHLAEYSVLGFLLVRAITGSDDNVKSDKTILLALAVGAVCGFTDELHQSVVPGRYATVADFIFDTLGIAAGIAVFYMIRKRRMINGKGLTF